MPGVTSKSMYSFGYKNPIINIQGVSTTLEDGNAAKKVRDQVWVVGELRGHSNSASFFYGVKEIRAF